MKLYKTQYTDANGKRYVRWSGSLAQAAADRTLARNTGSKDVKSEPIEFLVNKPGILELLNTKT